MLIFNKLKWFNVADGANSVTANGRKFYAIPKSVTISQLNERIRKIVENWNQASAQLAEDSILNVSGVSSKGYLVYGTIKAKEESRNFNYNINVNNPLLIEFSEAKNVNWGGNLPLSHLYQWLRAFITRKVVVVC